jgi:hypothetical protein
LDKKSGCPPAIISGIGGHHQQLYSANTKDGSYMH